MMSIILKAVIVVVVLWWLYDLVLVGMHSSWLWVLPAAIVAIFLGKAMTHWVSH